ncbi:MAG: DUF4296 domain-containing protein [Leadbetterella sp.]
MKYIVLAFILSFFSCSSDGSLSSEEKALIPLITDLQIEETKLTKLPISNIDTLGLIFHYVKNKVCLKHGIDSANFSKRYNLLSEDKEKLKLVYIEVEKRLKTLSKDEKPVPIKKDTHTIRRPHLRFKIPKP